MMDEQFIDTLSLDLKKSFIETNDLLEYLHDFDSDEGNCEKTDEENSYDDDSSDKDETTIMKDINTSYDDDELHDEELALEMERLHQSVESLREDLDTKVLLIARFIQKKPSLSKQLIALLDQDSKITMIHQRALPKGATPRVLPKIKESKTLVGTFQSRRVVCLQGVSLPQFSHIGSIREQLAFVFDAPDCACDIIVGRDLLSAMYIKNCEDNQIQL